jgi:23S rRNA (adenine2503-C2)-methyltransferase
MKQIELKGCNQERLEEIAEQLGQPAYRGRQLFHWMYARNVPDFDQMANLPKDFREKLAAETMLHSVHLAKRQISARGDAEKFLFRLHDGRHIESVLMRNDENDHRRLTLCISSQVGCPIDCKFCATGSMGLLRHLTVGEMIDQVLAVNRLSGERVTNVVVMGMGEPFLNYENLIAACELLCDEEATNLAQRHIVISTSGIIPKILRFTKEGRKYRLAISLNATTDDMRNRLMPLNKKYPIAKLLEAARTYVHASGNRLTFEYVLLAGINDTLDDAARLRTLLTGIDCKLNLIPFNAIDGEFQRPSFQAIEDFYGRLKNSPFPVTVRWSKGDDIDAACGQLVTKTEQND